MDEITKTFDEEDLHDDHPIKRKPSMGGDFKAFLISLFVAVATCGGFAFYMNKKIDTMIETRVKNATDQVDTKINTAINNFNNQVQTRFTDLENRLAPPAAAAPVETVQQQPVVPAETKPVAAPVPVKKPVKTTAKAKTMTQKRKTASVKKKPATKKK